MKTAIVTDSTSYLTEKEIEDNHIIIVPMPVIIDGKIYKEGVDITTEEFYDRLRTSQSFPSTSQPPLGEMIELYEKLAKEGYDTIISIHLASTISGFVSSLKGLEGTIEGVNLVVYDSQLTIRLMGILALEAARMAKDGADVDSIIKRLDYVRSTFEEYFVVDDLQNLVRGGRLSNASGFVGSLLKIKPILTFNDAHEIVAFEKVRSRKKAIARVETLFDEALKKTDYPIRAYVVHGNDEKSAIKWRDSLAEKYPGIPFEITYFGPVIGTHLGEKALALIWMVDYTKA
ncbi:DegV family protein [Pediococcus stilesii]|uniref:DegV family protein n=1 Tax=Pediococcus stilesii TaxID=331679 RepID=A0A5R9BWB0_9LACO|nr:DegV family protein [Pediococcus stilesii]TLQ04182.1 DegV family protein [Pediococcus stilesii]